MPVTRHSSLVTRRLTGVLAWAEQELDQAGVDAPRRTAELLLGFVLDWTRVRILSHPEAVLAPEQVAAFRTIVERRKQGEPLQYITGEQEFYGLRFRVSPGVLIPRPETEVLVEKALALAQNHPSEAGGRFVDVGTGSGCIAICIAHALPFWQGFAVDLSAAALEIARRNAARNEVGDRVQFLRADLLESFPARPIFDFILSNPPYVAPLDRAALPREVRDYEPGLALFGGEAGLEAFHRLIPQAAVRLAPRGYLLLEVGAKQSEEVARIAGQAGLVVDSVAADLRGIPRCITCKRV